MPQETLEASSFSPDVCDFLRLRHKHNVKYLIVGGEAVIFYGYARLTGDVDFFYALTTDNVRQLYAALREFWNDGVPGLAQATELLQPGLIVQFGVPPNRIDLVNRIDGVTFEEAWSHRREASLREEDAITPIF